MFSDTLHTHTLTLKCEMSDMENKKRKLTKEDGDSIKKKDPRRKRSKKIVELKDLPLRQLVLFNYYKRILKKDPHIADLLYGIDVNRKPISNRGLEHLVTNFSRKYDLRINENGEECDNGEFYVADEYYKHLPKTDTDPCCRGDLVSYWHNGFLLKTTIPQIGSNISLCRSPCLKYAEKNAKVIRKDLNLDKKIPQVKPTPDIVLPVKKQRSTHHMIPKFTHVHI